tara:strand:+ start:219 stop:539 length:321 start_codon:yes stop_codon:yes gene_type:complete
MDDYDWWYAKRRTKVGRSIPSMQRYNEDARGSRKLAYQKTTDTKLISKIRGNVMKQVVNKHWKRDTLLARKRQGRKTVSHGSYRAKRKPNSPRVTLEEHLKAKGAL